MHTQPRIDSRDSLVAVHLGLFFVQLSFSGFHVVGKIVLESIPPLALATARVAFATPMLLALAWLHDRQLPGWRHLPSLALLGLLGVFLNQVLFIVGLKFTTATNAAILMPSIPVFAVGIGWLTGIERVGARRLAGVALAVAGAVILLDLRRFSLADASAVGSLLILANCMSYATFLVLQRPMLARLPWRTVIAWSFLFGGLGVALVGGPAVASVPPRILLTTTGLGVFYIVLFPTFLGYLINTWAVRRSSPSVAATYTTLQPLLTALLAVLFLKESIGWPQIAGFLSIAMGLWLVSWRRR